MTAYEADAKAAKGETGERGPIITQTICAQGQPDSIISTMPAMSRLRPRWWCLCHRYGQEKILLRWRPEADQEQHLVNYQGFFQAYVSPSKEERGPICVQMIY